MNCTPCLSLWERWTSEARTERVYQGAVPSQSPSVTAPPKGEPRGCLRSLFFDRLFKAWPPPFHRDLPVSLAIIRGLCYTDGKRKRSIFYGWFLFSGFQIHAGHEPGRRPYHSECDLSRDVPAGRHHRRGQHGAVHCVLPPWHRPGGKSGEGLLPGVPGRVPAGDADLAVPAAVRRGLLRQHHPVPQHGRLDALSVFPVRTVSGDRGDDGELRLPAAEPVPERQQIRDQKRADLQRGVSAPDGTDRGDQRVSVGAAADEPVYVFTGGLYLGSRLFCRRGLHQHPPAEKSICSLHGA